MKRILLFVLLFVCFIAESQQYSYNSYSNDVGLPQSQVQSVTQDEHGYLWVGTLAGLAKFNGNEFIPFPSSKGLFKNRVSKVFYTNKTIYVGHEGGFSIIRNGKAIPIQLHSKHASFAVTDFIFFNNKLIISVEGGGIYSYSNKKLIAHPLGNYYANTVRSLCVFKGRLVIGTKDGLYATSDIKSISKIKSFENISISKCKVKGNKIHLTTFNNGYYQSRNLIFFKKIDLPVDQPYLTDIVIDNHDHIWIASDNGILKINGSKIEHINNEKGIPSLIINCIYQDSENNIWLGSDGKGLIKVGNENILNYLQKSNFPTDVVVSVCKKTNGNHLIGSFDKGLIELDKKGQTKSINLEASCIWQIENFKGKYWLGTESGFYSMDENNQIQKINLDSNNTTVRVVKKINTSTLFVASRQKIALINEKNEINYLNYINNIEGLFGYISDVIQYEDKLFIATTKGLFSIDLKNQKIKIEKSFNSIVASLCIDKFGSLWIGTENGVFIYNSINYTELISNYGNGSRFVNFLEPIDDCIYMGTNDGVYVYLADEKNNPMLVNHLGISNGLINLETNINSSYFDSKDLWFGTVEGLARINLNGFQAISPVLPKLSITELLVNFEPYPNYVSTLYNNPNVHNLERIDLPYSKNNLSILLDALFLEETKSIRYRYLLEGLNSSWTPLSNSNSIQLTNLPPGDYTLKIQAVTLGGISSETLNLPITIRSPFWQTWWFIIACILLLFLSIRFYFRMSLQRVQEKAEKEKLINESRLVTLEQQSLNASMNRHFIFNALNSIQYFIMTQDKLSATRYLSSFAKLIRKNLDSATEANNMVYLNEELERLELYLSLESIRFKDKFKYEIITNDIEFEHVKVPAMLLQPFVENAIIHGILPNEDKVGQITVEIKIVGTQLEILIDDNGIGIDASKTKKSGVEGDHISRGMEITTHRIELIRTILKKDYELIGPFQMENEDRSIKGTRVLIKIPYENLEI